MATYKNGYTKNEDFTLWELHEIRHRLHEARKEKSPSDVNKEALKKLSDWHEEKKRKAMQKTA